MSSNEKLDGLRAAIADESLGLSAQRTAASHYVEAVLAAVPEPGDDDAEVIELRTPWRDDGPLGNIAPWAWKQVNLADGFSEAGPTVAQAKRRIHDRLRLRALLAVVVDETAHKLERLEACQRVLDDRLHPQSFYRKNGYDAEKLLAKVLPAKATKYGGWNKPPVPVERPPQTFADVW